jgi:hypothetical protein
MKLLLHAIRTNPSHIEEIQMEDVASFSADDTRISIAFNDGSVEEILLRANDGENIHEWAGFSIFGTRIGLKIE